MDALRIEVATANADLERATNDLAFLERTFQAGRYGEGR